MAQAAGCPAIVMSLWTSARPLAQDREVLVNGASCVRRARREPPVVRKEQRRGQSIGQPSPTCGRLSNWRVCVKTERAKQAVAGGADYAVEAIAG